MNGRNLAFRSNSATAEDGKPMNVDNDTDEPGTGNPVHERSGPTVDAAVETAEEGSQVDGVHTPSGQEESGESRAERMADVPGLTEPPAEPTPVGSTPAPEPGPSPSEIGSGGAQRIVGARISDRVSAGEPVPDGLPFDSDTEPRS
jgi:hypothetical protein